MTLTSESLDSVPLNSARDAIFFALTVYGIAI